MDAKDLDRLVSLCGYLGTEAVAENLGLRSDELLQVMAGDRGLLGDELTELRELAIRALGEYADEYLEAPPELVAEVEDEPPPERVGMDLDGDGEPDVYVNVVRGVRGNSWSDEERALRDSLRRSLAVAQMSRFRVNMSHIEFVSALGNVTKIELALISWFEESVPDPSEPWDASRRWREVERRMARLRWVADEEQKEFGGIKGIFNRLIGKRRLSGKELYEKMVAEADWMVSQIRSGQPEADILSEVVSFIGMGAGPAALPGRGGRYPGTR